LTPLFHLSLALIQDSPYRNHTAICKHECSSPRWISSFPLVRKAPPSNPTRVSSVYLPLCPSASFPFEPSLQKIPSDLIPLSLPPDPMCDDTPLNLKDSPVDIFMVRNSSKVDPFPSHRRPLLYTGADIRSFPFLFPNLHNPSCLPPFFL